MMRRQSPSRRISICLVAHFAYGALRDGASGHIGGVERQTSFTAKWLAAKGHDVSLVTWDEGQSDGERIDGVKVLKLCRRDAGIAGVRFVYPRWSSLHRALARANAEVYYQNCAEYVTGQVALWCRLHDRRFVYSVASQPDCDPKLPLMKKWRDRILYRHGLLSADLIIVQTESQRAMLQSGFGRDAMVIPMPCPGPEEDAYAPPVPPANGRRRVLWVGRVCAVKRPDRYLDLAAACPDLQFDIVGPDDGTAFSRAVLDRAARLPNVKYHGAIRREHMSAEYEQAACLCCTSDVEGFPNTFLEAWSNGLPVVSTWDPDGLIGQLRLGGTATDMAGLERAIRKLLEDRAFWLETSENARRYYLDNHATDKVMRRFEDAFIGTTSAAIRRTA